MCYFPRDSSLNIHDRDNLKSHIKQKIITYGMRDRNQKPLNQQINIFRLVTCPIFKQKYINIRKVNWIKTGQCNSRKCCSRTDKERMFNMKAFVRARSTKNLVLCLWSLCAEFLGRTLTFPLSLRHSTEHLSETYTHGRRDDDKKSYFDKYGLGRIFGFTNIINTLITKRNLSRRLHHYIFIIVEEWFKWVEGVK